MIYLEERGRKSCWGVVPFSSSCSIILYYLSLCLYPISEPLNIVTLWTKWIKGKNILLYSISFTLDLLSLSLSLSLLFLSIITLVLHFLTWYQSIKLLITSNTSAKLTLLLHFSWFSILFHKFLYRFFFIQWIINLSSWVFLSIFFKFLGCAHSVLSLILFLESLSYF